MVQLDNSGTSRGDPYEQTCSSSLELIQGGAKGSDTRVLHGTCSVGNVKGVT